MSEEAENLLREFATDDQLKALNRYFELMLKWNESVNLTAITQPQEVYVKHFWDSLAVMRLAVVQRSRDAIRTVIDVGTGAGLPGMPLAICNPGIQVTLCDSLRKRTDFLQAVVGDLGLKNVSVYHSRSEALARLSNHRNQYDLVVARAVAKMSVLVELLVPLAKVGGHVACYKGPDVVEEVQGSENALALLKARLEGLEEFELPLDYGRRSLVLMKVLAETPKRYPRKAGTPQKQPL